MAEGQNNDRGFGALVFKDRRGNTPLHLAARIGAADVIRNLVDVYPEALEERNARGQTPLYLAALAGKKEGVECLLKAGADLLCQTDEGRTIWHAVATSGSHRIFKMVSKAFEESNLPKILTNSNRKSDKPVSKFSSIGVCVVSPKIDNIGTLKELSVKKEHRRKKKFNSQFPPIGGYILPKGIKIDNKGISSIESQDSDFVRISEKIFKHNKLNEQTLIAHTNVIQKLGISSQYYPREWVKKELNCIAEETTNFELKDDKDVYLLHIASYAGATDYVEKLLECNVNVNLTSFEGTTPLMLAASSDTGTVIDMLLRAGADYKLKDINGRTALHIAANWRNLEAVKKLLAIGLDPNETSNSGQTPLHGAAMVAKNASVLEELLKYGADKFIKDNSGATPVDYALKINDPDAVRVIQA